MRWMGRSVFALSPRRRFPVVGCQPAIGLFIDAAHMTRPLGYPKLTLSCRRGGTRGADLTRATARWPETEFPLCTAHPLVSLNDDAVDARALKFRIILETNC